jgi:hypothetical protein
MTLAAFRVLHSASVMQNRRMTDFIQFNRKQSHLLPSDLKRWLPEDDVEHFVIVADRSALLKGTASDDTQQCHVDHSIHRR